MSLNRFIIHLVIIFSVIGCKTIRSPVHVDNHYTVNDIYNHLLSVEPDIRTYSARRVSINIVDGDLNLNLRGFVRIKRDSVILISINAFAGIEAGRILITSDSVKIIDRLNNGYFVGDHEQAKQLAPFPLDFEILQGLFLGSTSKLFYGNVIDHNSNRMFSFEHDKITIIGEYEFSRRSFGNLQLTYNHDFKINRLQFYSDTNQNYIDVSFNSYLRVGDEYFPEIVKLNYISTIKNMHVEIGIGRVDFNEHLTFPFSIPSRYLPM